MPPGKKKTKIVLTEEEKQHLEKLVRKKNIPQKLAFRAQIILLDAEGLTNMEIAKRLKTTHPTISHWRKRFFEFRLDCFADAPRSGTPCRVSDELIAEVVELTLQTKPDGKTHWSTRQMATKVGLSRSTISRIWRTFGLKPHRIESFQLSTDPLFVEKVRDIVGLYLNPPDGALVISVDEKPQIQATKTTQPVLPMQPGSIEGRTSEYIRKGTTSLFAALDVASGKVTGKCYQRKRSLEFIDFLEHIDAQVSQELELHIILDNSSIHKSPPVKKWLIRNTRFNLHFTPTHSSWLNQVEVWFSLLERQQLKRGVYSSVQELENAISAYIKANNTDPKPFKWTKTADQIFNKLVRLCQRTLDVNRD